KSYGDGKADFLVDRHEKRTALASVDGWNPRAVLEQSGLSLRVFPSDRELAGHQTLLDPKRLARVLQEAGLVQPRSVRRRRTVTELLRYKPERRSVWRVDLSLRHGSSDSLTLAARVLPPEHAATVAAARAPGGAIDRAGVGPRLLASVGHTGLLLEEWLAVDVPGDNCFEHSQEVGGLVARLHSSGPVTGVSSAASNDRSALSSLFVSEPDLWAQTEELPTPRLQRDAWVHGDLHPDQVGVAQDRSGLRLLDLDNAGPGDRTRELASWIVDRLRAGPKEGVEEVTGELLAGYLEGGGQVPARGQLAAHVADLCVHAAAACFRRLENDAAGKAADLLALGRSALNGNLR
ncbi:MAG: hypothetical protein ACI8QS_003669, partial [Planctomycetota bacterium]